MSISNPLKDDRSHVGKLKADLVEFGSHTENIENKMVTIQRVIDEISNMQEEQWNERLNEDILLTKIENLERKVKVRKLSQQTAYTIFKIFYKIYSLMNMHMLLNFYKFCKNCYHTFTNSRCIIHGIAIELGAFKTIQGLL